MGPKDKACRFMKDRNVEKQQKGKVNEKKERHSRMDNWQKEDSGGYRNHAARGEREVTEWRLSCILRVNWLGLTKQRKGTSTVRG
jgi:hypothetical protein